MTIGQYKSATALRQAGFSMLDVLVAIVVLPHGIARARGASGCNEPQRRRLARALSDCCAYTKSVIEVGCALRSYTTMAPSSTFAQGATITPSTTRAKQARRHLHSRKNWLTTQSALRTPPASAICRRR